MFTATGWVYPLLGALWLLYNVDSAGLRTRRICPQGVTVGEQVHDARRSVVLFNDTTNTKQHEHDWGVEYGKLVKRSYASQICSAEDGELFEQLQGFKLLGLRKNTMFINSWRSVDSFKWLTIMKVIVGVRLFNVAEIVQFCLQR